MLTRYLITALSIELVTSGRPLSINDPFTRPKWGPLKTPAPYTSTGSPSSTTLAHDKSEMSITDDNSCVERETFLSLESIRSKLIRQEETIIFAIIERAQFQRNSIVYESGGFGDLGVPLESTIPNHQREILLSFLEFMLIGTEVLHCRVRRYTSPDEHPFFPERISLKPLEVRSSIGNAMSINFNPILFKKYVEWIVPSISKPGDDEQYGSAVLADIAVLQALSRRVHYGKFVAESKYRSDPNTYERLVHAGDAESVMKLLTNEVVEEKVLQRARVKAANYGTEPPIENIKSVSDSKDIVSGNMLSAVGDGDNKKKVKVNPTVIEDIYRKFIIPLTKDIEVAYLFRRCGGKLPANYAPDRMSQDLI